MKIDCAAVDAGARYGLHPTWAPLAGMVDFHLFEMDQIEADRLTAKYTHEKRIKVYPMALYSSDTEIHYNVSEHKALNSLYSANRTLTVDDAYMTDEFEVVHRRAAQARSLDSVFADRPIHFLKLDIEGAELDALKGGRKLLARSVLGVRSEVLFAPVFDAAPLFGDIHRFMLDEGFELLNLDYTGTGNKAGRFTLPNRYGKLLSSDAVWMLTADRLFKRTGSQLMNDVVIYALFLMLNGATDIAIDTLLKARKDYGVRLADSIEAPLGRELRRRVLFLLKSLTALPMFEEGAISNCYQQLYDADFPVMNQFYESEF